MIKLIVSALHAVFLVPLKVVRFLKEDNTKPESDDDWLDRQW